MRCLRRGMIILLHRMEFCVDRTRQSIDLLLFRWPWPGLPQVQVLNNFLHHFLDR